MGELTDKQIDFFDGLRADLARACELQTYNIIHSMNDSPMNYWVQVGLPVEALCGLFAYIEHVSFDVTDSCAHSLSESEIIDIVNKFYYPVTVLDREPLSGSYYEIDLYVNWEEHASIPYQEGMPELHRDELLDYIRELSIRYDWKKEYA